jgi:polysaccharide export outer membrane protein
MASHGNRCRRIGIGMVAVLRAPALATSAAIVLAGVALAGCAAFESTRAPQHAAVAPSAAASAPAEDYIIGPGDQLSVFVYDSPQLGAEVPVRPDGRISTPLVQDIVAAGKTPSQLGAEMAERLKLFIKDPHVTIILRGFVGPLERQVRVIGEAAEPLALPYRDHLTVLDVMIASKGLTRYAAGNRAVIVRRVRDKAGGERQETVPVRLSDLMKDGDIGQNVVMQPGDTLIIPQSWF